MTSPVPFGQIGFLNFLDLDLGRTWAVLGLEFDNCFMIFLSMHNDYKDKDHLNEISVSLP